MASGKTRKESQDFSPVLGDFYSLDVLWAPGNAGSRFLSEGAARWFIRQNRAALVQGKALALDCGRWIVNPSRFDLVRGQVAQDRAEGKIAPAQA